MTIMNNKTRKLGFTLTEIMIASMIMVIAVTMSTVGFIYVMKASWQSATQTELDTDLQIAMEKVKYNIRLSARDKILYYPPGTGITHYALSFPMTTNNANGQVPVDASNKIVWGKTVIYHSWTSPFTNQLRVTTFSPRNNNRTDTERQAQLAQVVQYGSGNNTNVLDHSNATTEIVFENVFEWNISEVGGDYDGYAPTTQREENVKLGTVILSNGLHEFSFTVTTNNTNSTGFKIGLDSLHVSPSGSKREAEAQVVTNLSSIGALKTNYMANGSWDGNYHLYLGVATNNRYFSLLMTNDCWEDTNFRGTGEKCDYTDVFWDTSLSPYDYVVALNGKCTNWQADRQTSDSTGVSSNKLQGDGIRVVLRGGEYTAGGFITSDGSKCRVNFKAGTGQPLCISNVYIAKAASSNGPDTVPGSSVAMTFSNGASKVYMIPSGSDVWTDYAAIPDGILKTNSYIVSYMVIDDHNYDRAWSWYDTNFPSVAGCYVMANANAADMALDHWDATQYVANSTLLGVQYLDVSYYSNGYYTSEIFDTGKSSNNVTYRDMTWNSTSPAGTSVKMQVRVGNKSDLSDTAWGTNWLTTSPYTIGAGGKYVQFKAMLTPDANFTNTPKLKSVRIGWDGDDKAVDISGNFTKGPDYGIWECRVDGQLLRKAVGITMSIYESVPVFGGGTNVLTSMLTEEIEPRNSYK